MERRSPFKHNFSYATLFAEDGRAMHKSWGNAIWFDDAAEAMGVDVMRWMYSAAKPEQNLLFGYKHSDEVPPPSSHPVLECVQFSRHLRQP